MESPWEETDRNPGASTYAEQSTDGAMDNLIRGWRLLVTLQKRTPLHWILRHGEFHSGPKCPDEKLPPELAVWLPETRTWRELGLDLDELPPGTMASEFGQVPVDGGQLLPFLIEYRKIVEVGFAPDEEHTRLHELYTVYPKYYRDPPIDPEKYDAFKKLSLRVQCERLAYHVHG